MWLVLEIWWYDFSIAGSMTCCFYPNAVMCKHSRLAQSFNQSFAGASFTLRGESRINLLPLDFCNNSVNLRLISSVKGVTRNCLHAYYRFQALPRSNVGISFTQQMLVSKFRTRLVCVMYPINFICFCVFFYIPLCIWLIIVAANEWSRYICNAFPHWLMENRPWSDKHQLQQYHFGP